MQWSKLLLTIGSFGFLAVSLVACRTKAPKASNNIETIYFKDNEPIFINPNTNVSPKPIEANTSRKDSLNQNTIDSSDIAITDTSSVNIDSLKKETYFVVVILPFQSDSVWRAWKNTEEYDHENMQISNNSDLSASFMQGFIMASKENTFKSKFIVNVYDNWGSAKTTDSLIYKKLLPLKDSIDLIIAPYTKNNVIKVCNFAKEHNISIISPFSPSLTASLNYKKYYQMEPSIHQHLKTIVDFCVDSFERANIELVYNQSDGGYNNATFFKNYIDTLKKDSSNNTLSYALTEIAGSTVYGTEIVSGSKNIRIINTFNPTSLYRIVRNLKNYESTGRIIFGMPGWESSKSIKIENLSNAQVHFTKPEWIDEETPDLAPILKNYMMYYKGIPNKYFFTGYDLVSIFFTLIDENGLNFSHKLVNTLFSEDVRDYLFIENKSDKDEGIGFENTKLHIYKINDYEQMLVK